MNEYAGLFEELHIVVPFSKKINDEQMGNLFIYYAQSSHKIWQKLKLFFKSKDIAKKIKPDVLTVQNPAELGVMGLLLARVYNIPLVVQVHTDVFSPWYRHSFFTDRIRYWLALLIIPRASRTRVVSDRIKKSIVTRGLLPAEKITVLPIYTDISKFLNTISDIQTEELFGQHSLKMIAVGRFVDKEKNFSMLIEVMKELIKTNPEAVLVIVGDGLDKDSYKRQVTRYKLEKNVILEPWRNDLPSFLKSFDLFVMPSNYEGWGRVVIEAMASGLPILMTDVGVAGEIVGHDREGIVVPVQDKKALLRAIKDLYNNRGKLERMGEAAKNKVIGLNPKTKKEYLELYKKSLDI
ncbi:MAG: glycosyltransferase family 4 protein [bacterium]|nr:glycosyltransferase family 4 protein [bacterium]